MAGPRQGRASEAVQGAVGHVQCCLAHGRGQVTRCWTHQERGHLLVALGRALGRRPVAVGCGGRGEGTSSWRSLEQVSSLNLLEAVSRTKEENKGSAYQVLRSLRHTVAGAQPDGSGRGGRAGAWRGVSGSSGPRLTPRSLLFFSDLFSRLKRTSCFLPLGRKQQAAPLPSLGAQAGRSLCQCGRDNSF